MKPIKRGYKLWVRADMDGYISKFDVYQGKAAEEFTVEGLDWSTFGLGEQVIQTMTQDLAGKNHEVYFDNFFTSIPLMEYLKENGINAADTVWMNRKALPVGMEEVLERGECDHRVSKDGVTMFKWQDSKPVFVVSNFQGTEISAVKRTQKEQDKNSPVLWLLLTTTNTWEVSTRLTCFVLFKALAGSPRSGGTGSFLVSLIALLSMPKLPIRR